MSQSIEVGSVLGGRYRITDHVVTSADQDLVFTGLDQVLNRRVTVLVASLENATQVASSARELATGERQDDIQVLDLGLSEGHTYLIAGGNPDPDVLLGLAYPQETYIEPFQTDTLGSEIFGSSRDAEAHEYDDDEAYYTELDERVRADQEQHSRRPGFLNRLSDRLSERMNASSDGSAARQAAGASALAAAGSAAQAQEEEKRKAEEAEEARAEEERRRAAEAERAERERREAEELERHRARQIEEDERREREDAERRAAERTAREEREAREAEERADRERRESDRRREADAARTGDRDGRGSADGDSDSTDPVPVVPAAGAAAGTDHAEAAPRRVRPAPRRALAAAAAADRRNDDRQDDRRDAEGDLRETGGRTPHKDKNAKKAGRGKTAAQAVSAERSLDGTDRPQAGDRADRTDRTDRAGDLRDEREGRKGGRGAAVAAGAGAAAVGTAAAAKAASGRDADARDADARDTRRGDDERAADRRGTAAAAAPAAAHPDGPRDPRDPEDDPREKKGAGRWLVATLLCLLLVAAVVGGFFLLNNNRNAVGGGESTATPTETTQPSSTEAGSPSPSESSASAEPASLVDIYRQVPDNPPLEAQHDSALPNIIDGNPETYWQGHAYTRPNFGGYARSMNFVIKLAEPRDIKKVTIDSLAGEGGKVAVGVAEQESLGDLRRGGEGTFSGGTAQVDITDPQGKAQYVVVTVTELPEINPNGQYRYGLQLSEITVE